VDCSACQTRDACPDIVAKDGSRKKAVACTNACLVPTAEETSLPSPFGATWEDGKVFSCRCGGDARTDPYCQFQKDTTFLFHVADGESSRGDEKDTSGVSRVKMHVKEYAGIPNLGEDALPWNYEYAFAPVWDANFTQCAWRVSSCLEPLPATEDCAIYECAAGKVQCPPADLPRCPGRDALGCGRGPNTTKKYWQHPCNPLVTPRDQGMTFWCSLNRTSTDAYGGGGGRLCYWNQQGVIPSFAVTCDVGNCVYDGAGGGEESVKNACPAVFTPPEFWTGDLITRVVMAFVAVALVFAAAWYVRLESASLYSVPAAAAFEHVAAMRAGGPRAPSKHVRTPSAVLGARRARRASPERLRDPLEGERSRSDERVPLSEDADDSDDDARDPSSASAPTARARPVVSWENVRVYATAVTASNPGGVVKKILRGVSGHAGPGPSEPLSRTRSVGSGSGVFAILGPSGAGKSTLLDFLAGRTPKGQASRGTVRVDGVRVSAKEMRAISGYVPQDDVLPGTSTVWEHLLFNAMLRLPERTPREELYRCVVGWSNELGLGKVAESRIGDQFTRGLSGGEKRRVSIATALLTSPAIMFLDEPTTGLDSTNAAKVVDILAALGDGGVTVVLSIHQPRPDVFRLLDRVLVMSKTGDVVYCGPSASAEAHFASLARPSHLGGGNARSARFLPEGVNVADYVLDTVLRSSDEDVRSMVTAFRGSETFESDRAFLLSVAARAAGSQTPFPSGARKKTAPFGKQLRLLCGRLLRKLFRHPFLIGVHFLASFSTALGVGFIFLHVGADQAGIQNRLGALFFVLLYLTLMSLSSLPVWREDRLLFLRERADGVYGVDAYFISALLFDVLPMRVLPPFFFGLTTYAMIGLNEGTEVSLVTFVLTLVFTNVCATCMCMAIGAAAKSVAVANAVASLCFLVATLFGGFLLNKDQIPWYVKWVAKLSFLNYGYEALVANEFANNPTTFTLTAAWNSSTLPDEVPVPGEKVLSTFGFDSDRMFFDILAVCTQAVAFAALCYLMLRNAENGPWRAAMDWLGRRAVARDGDAGSRRRSLDRERDANTAPLLGFASGGDDDDDSVLGVALDVDEESSEDASSSMRFPKRGNERLTDIDEESSVRGAPAALAALRDAETAEASVRFFDADAEAPFRAAPFERHVLSWEDVTCDLVGGRAILRGVSGIAGVDEVDPRIGSTAHHASASTAADASPFGPFITSSFAGRTRTRRAALFAILGPSGAGKSTLLDILAGRPSANRVVGGTIRVNGVVADAAAMRGLAGYVPQDDVLPGTSTVWEHLTFHATLRIKRDGGNRSTSTRGADDFNARIRSIVSNTMRSLGVDGVAHAFVGDEWTRGLSGGEKRRVSIATELLTSPAIMFLDEPTTGLDSTNAAKVVDILAALGDGGVTVVLSIHQPRPDVFRLLDRILVMSGTGRAVYSGASNSAEAHFESLGYAPPRPEGVNVADYVLDVVLRASDDEAQRMVLDFDASAAAARDATARARIAAVHAESGTTLPRTRKFRASFATQTKVLWGRVAKNVRRHPFLIALHFLATATASVFVGAVFRSAGRDTGGIQNRMGSLFFILLYLTLMSLSSLPVWREDRALFLREKAAGAYDTASYFVTVVVFDVLALRVLPPLFFALVAYPAIGLRGFSEDADPTPVLTLVRCVCVFVIVLVLVNVAASALCMAIGIVAPSNATANACGLLCLLVNVLCGGFFLNEQTGVGNETQTSFNPTRILTGFSFVNRAFEALLINEFLDAGVFEFTPKFKNAGAGGDKRSSISVDVDGDEVLRFFKFGDSNATLVSDLSALCGLALGYVALAFFLLKWTTRRMGVD
jgi:ATP-binding cassette subfamily G (WHITE) protein 2